jgi:hypothetical protein
MEIKKGQKWIALHDTDIFDDIGKVISHFNEGDMITITFIAEIDIFPYFIESIPISLNRTEIINYFIPLAEWRNKQINIK